MDYKTMFKLMEQEVADLKVRLKTVEASHANLEEKLMNSELELVEEKHAHTETKVKLHEATTELKQSLEQHYNNLSMIRHLTDIGQMTIRTKIGQQSEDNVQI
ncbi:hypothetical protein L596_000112 [Steinernema carpocapsae]|uniref:Uncharacterized protein n=1 Tax=Steinernema carpocapsae TaxID=34508 RepID=A0A4U8UJL3_STECR|nr:hypothetical protein L596_000112 [Steinernema carpocapsae]